MFAKPPSLPRVAVSFISLAIGLQAARAQNDAPDMDMTDPRLLQLHVNAPPLTTELDANGLPPGFVLVDGDMVVPAQALGGVLAATYETNLWPGVVPYVFDSNVSMANRVETIASMQAVEAVCTLRFVPWDFDAFIWVRIRDSSSDSNPGNNSQVGMSFPAQILNMTSWTGTPGPNWILVHELGHLIGFYHEHTRPDRGNFVTINTNNIQDGRGDQFELEGSADAYGPYDFDSIMHYARCAFSIGCPTACTTCTPAQQTITVHPPYTSQWQNNIGQRTHLSYWDSLVMSFLYRRPEWRFQAAGGDDGGPGDFLDPYETFREGWEDTPPGGTLWVMYPSTHGGVDWVLDKPMTIAAPLGGVVLAR